MRFNVKKVFVTVILSLSMAMTSCTTRVTVSGDVPNPKIDMLPFVVGIHYSDKLKSYKLVENAPDRKWNIKSGKSQVQMFNTVLKAKFKQLILFDEIPTAARDDIDLMLVPSIKDFQYATPRDTNVNIYEVWVKYNIAVFNAQGQLIADWVLTAYGKTPTAFMRTPEAGMKQAVMMSLRDAGAGLALRFDRVPEIKSWLDQQQVKQNTVIDEPQKAKDTINDAKNT